MESSIKVDYLAQIHLLTSPAEQTIKININIDINSSPSVDIVKTSLPRSGRRTAQERARTKNSTRNTPPQPHPLQQNTTCDMCSVSPVQQRTTAPQWPIPPFHGSRHTMRMALPLQDIPTNTCLLHMVRSVRDFTTYFLPPREVSLLRIS